MVKLFVELAGFLVALPFIGHQDNGDREADGPSTAIRGSPLKPDRTRVGRAEGWTL